MICGLFRAECAPRTLADDSEVALCSFTTAPHARAAGQTVTLWAAGLWPAGSPAQPVLRTAGNGRQEGPVPPALSEKAQSASLLPRSTELSG